MGPGLRRDDTEIARTQPNLNESLIYPGIAAASRPFEDALPWP
jgi:hypothetical protein